jgi:hypothetical protein
LRSWRLIVALLAISGVTAMAQDQNAPAAQQDQSQQGQSQQNQQQNQPQQNPVSPGQSSPEQTPPPQNPAAQNQSSQGQSGQNPPQGQNDKASQENEKKQDIPGAVAEATKKFGQLTLNKVVDWENGWLTGPYVGKDRELVAMTGQQRWKIYLEQTFTLPGDYFKRMVSATFDQWRNSPPQWGQGWGAFGERFASREGHFIASNSLAALGDAALKYEPRYDQCKCDGFLPRTRHAIVRNFLTYDQSEKELRPQWALYGGAFGGGVIATSWKPHPRNALVNGGWGMVGQAAYGIMFNFFTEFAGDINQKVKAKINQRKINERK